MSVEATPILSISRRKIVLISNMSDMEGPDSADLPKVNGMQMVIYLFRNTIFY